jgi:hypothetical protein
VARFVFAQIFATPCVCIVIGRVSTITVTVAPKQVVEARLEQVVQIFGKGKVRTLPKWV